MQLNSLQHSHHYSIKEKEKKKKRDHRKKYYWVVKNTSPQSPSHGIKNVCQGSFSTVYFIHGNISVTTSFVTLFPLISPHFHHMSHSFYSCSSNKVL